MNSHDKIIDCHVHVFDPARFPYAADAYYRPEGAEIGTLYSRFRTRVCSHYSQPIGDEREVDEGDEHEIEFLKPREDAAKAF